MTPEARRILFDAEAQAEWLIGLLRLVISTSLFAVLFLTLMIYGRPESDVVDRQLTYAVMTMGSYFVLGIAIVIVIRAGRFRRWMVWVSALVDCVFVLLGTWLSLSNIGLSGQYISAFPTIWLIPVVLACGALRFNPTLLAVMAVVLVFGYLTVLNIPFLVPEDVALGQLGFFFGWPPNIVRAVMIALAAMVLVLASMRIRTLLHRSIEEAQGRVRLTRFLPKQLEARLAQTGVDDMRGGAVAPVAVAFIDIRGFTAMTADLDPEAVSRLLTGFRSCILRVAEQENGIVDKFIGDGAMIAFEDTDGSAARRALHFTRATLKAVSEWQPDVSIGIGAHYGDAFTGVVGDAGRLEYTVLGDMVNVASRLEAATKGQASAILVSDALMSAAGVAREGWVACQNLTLPGRKSPVDAWGWPP